MLSAANRLTSSQDFALTVRRGRRAGRSRLVVHLLRPPSEPEGAAPRSASGRGQASANVGSTPIWERQHAPQVGFVVSKAVGNAVMRHRVSRQLRHLLRERVECFSPGTRVVVRALPRAAGASSVELAEDLDGALRRLHVAPAPGSAR